ncbi:MAG TPA: hypothetical protein VIQ51_11400, partial [Chryseosolibacter sp.]
FEVTVGKECKPVGEQDLLEDVNMIAEITPTNSSVDVDVFNTPQVAFNIPVGEIFEIKDLEKRTHYFRAVLDEFVILEGVRQIQGSLTWNEERDVVIFDASDLLPGRKKLKARARLAFEEKINGVWTRVKFDGKIVSETAESDFETGEAPDFIPERNVALSYPLPDQFNFHPKEYRQGFIQLREGQPYLFTPTSEWIQKVRMTEVQSGEYLETTLSYNPGTRQITFPLPDGFKQSHTYDFQIVNIPRESMTIDQNVKKIDMELGIDESAGSATLTRQSIEGTRNQLEVKAIYTARFRCSKYNTFVEKMNNISLTPVIRLSPSINDFQLTTYLRGDESFEDIELLTRPGVKPIIRMEAILEGNSWYENHVYPLVYEGYPLLGWMKVRRSNILELGLPPVRDIYFDNIGPQSAWTKNNDAPGAIPFTNELLVYNLNQSVASDFRDIQRHAVNYVVDHPSQITPRIEALVVKPMPHIRYGAYRLRLNYVIPGINETSSTYEVMLFNRTPDND